MNGFFVPSSPPFDVVVDSGSAHVRAEQDGVVGWRGENGLPSEILGPLDFVLWSTQPVQWDRGILKFSIFVLVELAWDNAGKRTGSSNHEKTT